MTTLQEATTATTASTRVVERLARGLGRFSRRGFLVQTAVVGSALAVDPKGYVLKPQTAASTVCGPAASCSAGYTVMCCTINKGVNACPPGTFAAGWWKAADSSWCCGGYRYITDCNATCSDCSSGCSGDNICDKGCWSCSCKCGSSATCDQRRVCCNAFRYGQCNTHVRCSGGVACRVVSCVAPYKWANCTTTSLTDNATAEHNAPCNQGCGPILTLYNSLNSLGSPLGASTGPERPVGDGRGRYVNYQHGAISWTSTTGAHSVSGYPFQRWSELGRERGVLGYPTTERRTSGSSWVQFFEKGALADTSASATAYVYSAFFTVWKRLGAEKGALGYPLGNALRRADSHTIQYFQHGVVADTARSASSALTGYPYTRWRDLGGERGVLGYPITDRVPSGNGWVQRFEKGAMCDTTSSSTVYLTGASYTRWTALGRQSGTLGYALTDPRAAVRGGGGQTFQHGELWWRSGGTAFVVRGAVLERWTADGGAGGRWGYPLADAVDNGDGTSSQTFEGGVLTA